MGARELMMSKDNRVMNITDNKLTVNMTIKSNKIINLTRYLKNTNNNIDRIDTGVGIKKNIKQKSKKLSQKDSDNVIQVVLQFDKDTIKEDMQKTKKELSNDISDIITYLYNSIQEIQELHKKKDKTISTLYTENRGLKEEIKSLQQEEQQKKIALLSQKAN